MRSLSSMLSAFTASVLLVLLTATNSSMAQVVPTSSIDPLMGSSFSTPVFTPANTFTPTTTFASAASRTPTAISGPGPSVDPASYTFSYDRPFSTIPGTPLGNLYSSLAANGTPTAATSALVPDPSNLQIVPASTPAAAGSAVGGAPNAASSSVATSLSSVMGALAAGIALVAFF